MKIAKFTTLNTFISNKPCDDDDYEYMYIESQIVR